MPTILEIIDRQAKGKPPKGWELPAKPYDPMELIAVIIRETVTPETMSAFSNFRYAATTSTYSVPDVPDEHKAVKVKCRVIEPKMLAAPIPTTGE